MEAVGVGEEEAGDGLMQKHRFTVAKGEKNNFEDLIECKEAQDQRSQQQKHIRRK